MKPIYSGIVLLAVTFCISTVAEKIDYKLTVKTGRGLLAGTDSVYLLKVWSGNHSSVAFEINGKANILDRGSEDQLTFNEKELPGIEYVTIQRVSPYELFQGWFLSWIKIEVRGAVYQVVVNRWIKDKFKHRYTAFLESCPRNYKRVQYCKAPGN